MTTPRKRKGDPAPCMFGQIPVIPGTPSGHRPSTLTVNGKRRTVQIVTYADQGGAAFKADRIAHFGGDTGTKRARVLGALGLLPSELSMLESGEYVPASPSTWDRMRFVVGLVARPDAPRAPVETPSSPTDAGPHDHGGGDCDGPLAPVLFAGEIEVWERRMDRGAQASELARTIVDAGLDVSTCTNRLLMAGIGPSDARRLVDIVMGALIPASPADWHRLYTLLRLPLPPDLA